MGFQVTFEHQNMWKTCPVPEPHSIKAKGQSESMTPQFVTLTEKGVVSDDTEPTMPTTQWEG